MDQQIESEFVERVLVGWALGVQWGMSLAHLDPLTENSMRGQVLQYLILSNQFDHLSLSEKDDLAVKVARQALLD